MKILWSIDAFQLPKNTSKNSIFGLLKLIQKKNSANIETGFVLSPVSLNLWPETTTISVREYEDHAKKSLANWQKKNKTNWPSHVLINESPSTMEAARILADYASHHQFDLIVCQSHQRKGLSRLLLGSFAENLLLKSKKPVLILGAEQKCPADFKKILFVTDLSHRSHKAFVETLKLAKKLKSEIEILNVITVPSQPVIQSGVALLGAGWVPVESFLDTSTKSRKTEGTKWVDLAKSEGCKAKFYIAGPAPSVTAAVQSHLKKSKCAVIALAAQSGTLETMTLGSITRNLVRTLKEPVLVVRESK